MTPPVAGPALRVEILRTHGQLADLQAEWSRLHQRDTHSSAWTEPHLLCAFNRMYVPTHRPLVLVARAADGTARGVLPLAFERHRVGPVYLRRIVPLAGAQVCYPDAVIDPGTGATVMAALATALGQMPWDELRFRWVKPDSHLLNATHGLGHGVPELRSEPGDPLWQPVLLDQRELLHGGARKEMLRRSRRLSERGTITIGWESPERVVGTAAEFVALHTRLKDFQKQLAFYRLGTAGHDSPQWLGQESAAGRAGLFTIRCDGALIAGAIILRHRDRAACFRVAWDPTFATFGLGILLMTRAMEACRERGDRNFDVGHGVETYKGNWASRDGQTMTISATRDTWRSEVARRWLALRRHPIGRPDRTGP